MKPKFNIGDDVTWVGKEECRYNGRIYDIEALPYKMNDDVCINMCYYITTGNGEMLIPEEILTRNVRLSSSTVDELKLTIEQLGYVCIKKTRDE